MIFDWDKGNLEHIAEHGITRTEVEEAVDNDPLDLEVQMVAVKNGFCKSVLLAPDGC